MSRRSTGSCFTVELWPVEKPWKHDTNTTERQDDPRILLVDDHALFRESVARVLADEPELRRRALREHSRGAGDAGAAASSTWCCWTTIWAAERASQFLPAARQAGFEGRVLVVTAWVSDNEARRLMRQGVAGIFLKQAPARAN